MRYRGHRESAVEMREELAAARGLPDQGLAHVAGAHRHEGDVVLASEVEFLRRWEYDASETCVATEEGMPNGDSDLLQRILLALGHLAVELDLEMVGPTKQHGIPRAAVRSK